MRIKISSGGERNVYVTVSGLISKNDSQTPAPIFYFHDLKDHPKTVRMDDVQFAIREKMGFNLWWILDGGFEIAMPLESRGYFDWEKSQSLHCAEGSVGMAISPFNVQFDNMAFIMVLGLVRR